MSPISPIVRPLVTKLRNYAALSPEEEQILDASVAGVRGYEPGQDIVVEGTSPDHSCLLLTGLVARTNMSAEGKRQITALHVAGDFVDLHSFLLRPMDHSIIAVGTSSIAVMSHAAITAITEQHPNLTRLLWLNTLIDAGIQRRWAFVLGTLQASQQLAHLICETYLRMKQVGRTKKLSFHLPITQQILGECMALSIVHTNRTIQFLRAEKLISWERDLITIQDWDRLVELGEFDPTYLRMPKSAETY